MKRHSLVAAGFSAAVALGLIGYGCSSSDTVSGTGGSNGSGGHVATSGQGGSASTGQGGSASTGQGGSASTGQGGSASTGQGGTQGGAGGMTGGTILTCAVAPTDKVTACNSDPACTKNCGLNLSSSVLGIPRAQKLCTCPGPASTWQCPSAGACTYPTGFDLSCFHLPAPLPLCPAPATGGLIIPNASPCTLPAGTTCGMVCGSMTANSYQDSGGAGKVGYCACVGKAAGAVWECSSVNEWPPQQ